MPRGAGSIEPRNGRYRWIAQYRGQRLTGTTDTRAEALIELAHGRIELGATTRTRMRCTAGELVDAWLAQHRKADDWSPTYAADMRAVAAKMPDSFLVRNVESVTPQVVASLYRQLTREGWSAHRVQRVGLVVSGAWRLGVEYGFATSNPTRDVSAPSFDKPNVNPPDNEVVRDLIAAAPSPALALFLRLAVITAARLGELVAVRWDDLSERVVVERDERDRPVEVVIGTVAIRRAAVYTPDTGLVVRNQTKTGRKGDRRLDLDDGTYRMLLDRRAAQDELVADANSTIVRSSRKVRAPRYVFSHDGGVTPWRPGYAGLEYRRLRAKVPGAEGYRFHDLRHKGATDMLADGESPFDVAGQLGHANPATTLRVYAHYLEGRGRASATKRAGRLDP